MSSRNKNLGRGLENIGSKEKSKLNASAIWGVIGGKRVEWRGIKMCRGNSLKDGTKKTRGAVQMLWGFAVKIGHRADFTGHC